MNDKIAMTTTTFWKDCDLVLPTEWKRYGIRMKDGTYTTDIRTHCLHDREIEEYRWRRFHNITHWCNLPNAYSCHGNGAEGWTEYKRDYTLRIMICGKRPVFTEYRRYFFITLNDGSVDIRLYDNDIDSFDGDSKQTDNERHVCAWMAMPLQ